MKSSLPKVLQPLAGKSLLERVLNNCKHVAPDRRLVIVGHQSDRIKQHLKNLSGLEFVLQEEQKGTGHAVQQLIKSLQGFEGELLVLNGDVPLLRSETIKELLDKHRSNDAGVTFLSTIIPNPKGYGRVIADKQNIVKAIIEDCDCNKKEQQNKLVNAGIYCFDWQQLAKVLPKLQSKNNQNEIYLTDSISMLPLAIHLEVNDSGELCGINDRIQLAECEALLQQRLRKHWMREGVTFIDPFSSTLSEDCSFGKDVVIEPQTHLRGRCQIGDNCTLGPNCFIKDSSFGRHVNVIHSVITESRIGNNVQIGPFAHLRPESDLSDECKIGNFVEIKKSSVAQGSKINHLSYIGDAKLGSNVNIGAGTIIANYDGILKHQTIIGEASKTGANSVLVAPIKIGSQVTIGAGSTITKNVPSGSLAIERSKQIVKEGWSLSKKTNL